VVKFQGVLKVHSTWTSEDHKNMRVQKHVWNLTTLSMSRPGIAMIQAP
jgi:hypothetical protein